MKRFLASILVFLSAFSIACASPVSFEGLSDSEVVQVAQMAQNELLTRGIIKKAQVPQGVYTVGVDLPAGTYSVTQDGFAATVEVYPNATSDRDIVDYTIYEGDTIGRLVLENGQRLEINHHAVVFTVYTGIVFQ